MTAITAVKSQRRPSEFARCSDEDVMRAVQVGSETARTELVRRFSGRLFQLAWRITRSPEDAEDAVQSAWLKVFAKAQQFQFRSKVGTWIHRVTFTEALMVLRRRPSRRGRRVESLEQFFEWQPNHRAFIQDRRQEPDRLLEERELVVRIEGAVNRLREPRRWPFVLCVMGGMSPKTCATVLDISYPAVTSRLHHARLAIRRQLGKHLNGRR